MEIECIVEVSKQELLNVISKSVRKCLILYLSVKSRQTLVIFGQVVTEKERYINCLVVN
jgi:hypothetical protein